MADAASASDENSMKAKLRASGEKLELTEIPAEEWKQVTEAAKTFWDEKSQISDRAARVVSILREYNEVIEKAGPPYGLG